MSFDISKLRQGDPGEWATVLSPRTDDTVRDLSNLTGFYGLERGTRQLQANFDLLKNTFGIGEEYTNLSNYAKRQLQAQEAGRTRPEMEEVKRVYESEGSLADWAGVTGSVVAESLPQAVPGLVGAIAGLPAGPVGSAAAAMTATAANSFMTEYYGTLTSEMQQMGVDVTDPDQVKKIMENPAFEDVKVKAIKRASVISGFDAVSMGVAGRLLKTGSGLAKLVGTGSAEIGAQSALAMSGEAGAQLLTEGRVSSPVDVALEGLAETVTGTPEIAIGAFRKGKIGAEKSVKPTTQEEEKELEKIGTLVEPSEESSPVQRPKLRKTKVIEPVVVEEPAQLTPKPTSPDIQEPVKDKPKEVPETNVKDASEWLAQRKSKKQPQESSNPLDADLPSVFSGIKPRYKTTKLNFKRPLDSVVYSLADSTFKSKREQDLLSLAKERTGLTEAEIRNIGKQIKQEIGKIVIPGSKEVFLEKFNYRPAETPKQTEAAGEEPSLKKLKGKAKPPIVDTFVEPMKGADPVKAREFAQKTADQTGTPVQVTLPKGKSVIVEPSLPSVNKQVATTPEVAIGPSYVQEAPRLFSMPLLPETQTRLTPRLTAIEKTVKSITGPSVKVKPVSTLMGETSTGKGQFLRGAQFDNSVFLAMETNEALGLDVNETAYHESWHYLRETGQVFTPSDIKLLESSKPELDKVLSDSTGMVLEDMDYFSGPEGAKEVEATVFGLWATGKVRINGPVKTVFSKVKTYLKKLSNLMRGAGFRTMEDLFKSVQNGDYSKAEVNQNRDSSKVTRFQKLVSEISDKQTEKLLSSPESLDLQSKVTKSGSISDLNNFVDWAKDNVSLFSSTAHLATKDGVMAAMFHLFDSIESTRLSLTKHFSGKLNDLISDKAVFNDAGKVLDFMVNTDQSISFTKEGELLFEKDGKLLKTSKGVGNVAKGLQELTKDVVKFYDTLLRNVLSEQNLPKDVSVEDVRIMQEFYAEKAVEAGENRQLQVQSSYLKKSETFGIIGDQLETAQKLLKSNKAWMPRIRFGSWAISVQRKNADGKMETVGLYTAEDGGKLTNKSKKEMLDYLNKDFPDKRGLKISEPFELTYANMQNKISDVGVSAELIAGLLSSDTSKSYADVLEGAAKSVKERVRMKGFQKHFLERKNIKGYDKDYVRSMSQYLMSATNGLTNLKFSNALVDVESSIPQLQGIGSRKRKIYEDYFNQSVSPEEEWAKIRTVNFMWAMGLNPSTAILQLITPLINSPAYVMQWDSSLIKNVGRSTVNTTRALKFVNPKDMRKESSWKRFENSTLFSKDEKEMIRLAWDNGTIQAVAVEDFLYGTEGSRSTSKDVLTKSQEFMGLPMQALEHVSRISSLLTVFDSLNTTKKVESAMKIYEKDKSFQQFREINKELTDKQVITLYAVRELHAVYGKHARAAIENTKLAKVVFPFMTFPTQQFEMILRLFGSRGQGGRLAGISITLLYLSLAGMLAFPGSELLKALYKVYNKVYEGDPSADLKLDIQKYLVESGLTPMQAKTIVGGSISSALGVEIGSRISPTMPYIDTAARWAQNPTLGGVTAVFGSVADGIGQSVNTLANGGSPLEALSKMFPIAGPRNVMQAAIWSEEGVKTAKGNKVVSEEDLTNKDILLKSIGFTPSAVAEKRDLTYAAQLKRTAGATAKQRLSQQYARILYEIKKPTNTPEHKKEFEKKLNLLKDDVVVLARKLQEEGITIDKDWFDGFETSVKRQLMNLQDPEAEYRKSKRVDFDSLKNIYVPEDSEDTE